MADARYLVNVPIGCLIEGTNGEVGRVKERDAPIDFHPLGIRVILEDGTVCRAKDVKEPIKPVEPKTTSIPSLSFMDEVIKFY